MRIDRPFDAEWVHLQHGEPPAFAETYGFAGNQGVVNLEGIRFRPQDAGDACTLLVFMHPTSTLQLLPMPRALAAAGAHVLCAASRYARNDSALILEKVLLDLGAWIRHAKTRWGYRHVVLVGWSGGGSLAMSYQAQAEAPDITRLPSGEPADFAAAGLVPADAVVFQAAHLSRARLLLEAIDPSVCDESRPDERDAALDLYAPSGPHRPPYDAAFVDRYRAQQLVRMRRITGWVKHTLDDLRRRGTGELERGFVVHRTLADPRFLDPALEPNGRRPGWCYMGDPETVNSGPVGLARFCTLRSWLSQWSIDDTRGDALAAAARMRPPLLVIENGADDAVPPSHPRRLFEAAATADKRFHLIEGATHYYAGQPSQLVEAASLIDGWLAPRGLRAA